MLFLERWAIAQSLPARKHDRNTAREVTRHLRDGKMTKQEGPGAF